MIDYEKYDALALADLVRRREVSPKELLHEACKRIDERNPELNAVVWENRELSVQLIEDGLPDGPFCGVPLLVKDSGMPVTGFVSTNGCRFFEGATQTADSELTSRMRKAGFVFAGMTTSPEFGMNITTEARIYGRPTRNPWNLERSAGGSSGGSAAAVAAGIVPMAAASDGAGSIRIPASACGLFGLKPSRGRVPAGPKKGEGLAGLASYHAVSRSVRDSAAMLDALGGADLGAPYAAPTPDNGFLEATRRAPGRLRIGLVETSPNGTPIADECLAAIRETARLCESLGHHVEPTTLPNIEYEQQTGIFKLLIGVSALGAIEARSAILGRQPNRDELEPVTWEAMEYASRCSAFDYSKIVSLAHALGRKHAQHMLGFDVLLTPTLQHPPAPLGTLASPDMTFEGMFAHHAGHISFLSLANAAGVPAMSVPLTWTSDGLPIGSHFMGAFGQEQLLFCLAAQLEIAEPWFDKRPPMALQESPAPARSIQA
ncbi:amidase [Variovorax atrisoli]|uniref:amidase n=1 Tax=Variovorax atrisoli TaxID=3394203 RepID=UPI00339A0028